MAKSLVDRVNVDNWKEFAKDLAMEKYPIDSIVTYHKFVDYFGVVESISDKGIVRVKCGEPKWVKTVNKDRTTLIKWYDSDITKFHYGVERNDPVHGKNHRMFQPQYIGDDWKKYGHKYPINWNLRHLDIEKNGLIKLEVHLID